MICFDHSFYHNSGRLIPLFIANLGQIIDARLAECSHGELILCDLEHLEQPNFMSRIATATAFTPKGKTPQLGVYAVPS